MGSCVSQYDVNAKVLEIFQIKGSSVPANINCHKTYVTSYFFQLDVAILHPDSGALVQFLPHKLAIFNQVCIVSWSSMCWQGTFGFIHVIFHWQLQKLTKLLYVVIWCLKCTYIQMYKHTQILDIPEFQNLIKMVRGCGTCYIST